MCNTWLLSLLFGPGLLLSGTNLAALDKTLASHLADNKWAAAVQTLRDMESIISKHAPLEIIDGAILMQPASGLGLYKPVFKGEVKGDELFLYAQVRHHGIRRVHDHFELHLVSDIIVLDKQGKEIARDEGFGESRFSARVPHRDTFVMVALRVKGLAAGRYTVRLVLKDKVANKSTQRDFPFVLGTPAG
jgi:hypothetical protein